MIDSIKLRYIGEFNTDNLGHRLERVKSYGQYIKGFIRNMCVIVKPWSEYGDKVIIIEGSLTKFRHGNNVASMNYRDVRLSIKEISDILQMDITEMDINKIHISENLILRNPVVNYFDVLLKYPKWKKWVCPQETVSFLTRGSKKTIMFYDKKKELKDTRKLKTCPKELRRLYILRYECKINSSLKAALKTHNTIRVKDILTREGYNMLVDYWLRSFNKIILKEISSDEYKVNKGSELTNWLVLKGVDLIGYDNVLNRIKQINVKPQNKNGMIKKIDNLLRDKRNVERGQNLTIELKEAIGLIYKYHYKQVNK